MWTACVRDGIQVVTFSSVDSHSMLSTGAKFLVGLGPEHRGVALEKAKTAAENTASKKVTSESTARIKDDSAGISAYGTAFDADLVPSDKLKRNDFLHIRRQKLTVTVCPRCKAIDRCCVLECHWFDEQSRHGVS